MRRRLAALAVMSLMLFGTAACGGGGDQPGASGSASPGKAASPSKAGSSAPSAAPSAAPSVDMGAAIPGLTVTGAVGSEPTVKVDAPLKVDGIAAHVVTAGKGNPVKEGQPALLHITVVNGRTGKKSASTYDQGNPAAVQMTQGSIFPAMLQVLVGKPQGTRVALAAPVEQMYGASGAKQLGLKPTDTVVFVVDVVSVPPVDVLDGPKGTKQTPPSWAPGVVEKNGDVTGLDFSKAPTTPDKKFQVVTLVKGDGPPVRDDSLVTFDYLGEVWGAKKPFDESYSKDPVTFPIGVGQLIKGWDKGLVGVPKGSRVMIIAPPDYGYGPSGNPQAGIKGTDTLVFVVDVLGVDG